MAILLFDPASRNSLAPLSSTKALADFRFGIFSVKERWELLLNEPAFVHTINYLQPLYPVPDAGCHTWIDAAVIPSEWLVENIQKLHTGQALVEEGKLIAGKTELAFADFDPAAATAVFTELIAAKPVFRIEYPWEMMQLNETMIREDFKLVTRGRQSQAVSPTVQLIQQADIFIEEGARLECCTLNAAAGPIYIGKNAEVMEGSSIRGPFSLGFNAVLKMNSRIYGATSLGPYCMGGGEIKNSIMMGFSNKAHDGYMGDSVVGEWCNFGAGTSNSNLKNSAGDIAVWAMGEQKMVIVGQKCGVIMGDYSRLSINSSVNTGSVIGVSCNVFGSGLLPKRIDHFSWGVEGKKYDIDTAITDINNWKSMKSKKMSDAEMMVLKHIFHSEK